MSIKMLPINNKENSGFMVKKNKLHVYCIQSVYQKKYKKMLI